MRIIQNATIIPNGNRASWLIENTTLQDDDYVLQQDEIDITSPSDLEILYRNLLIDYVQKRDGYKWLGLDFTNLTDEVKAEVVKYCGVDQTTCVTYYVGKGMTVNDATYLYLTQRVDDIRKASECFHKRLEDPKFTLLIMLHLGQNQGETFLGSCRDYISDLKSTAILGTNYGNNREGFFDYLEATGSYIGAGASTFDYASQGSTYETFRDAIKNHVLYKK